MSTKYEMEFNDGGTAGGLKKISDAHKDAAATGKEMGQQTGKATEQIHKEGDEAARTAKYLENLGKSYQVTTNDVSKYSNKASDGLNRATTSLHAFGTGVGPLQSVGQAAQRTAESIGKLGGTASFLGDKDMVAATQGLNAFAGGLAATSTPLGALMAIVASGIVVMKELNKTTVEGADTANIFDKAWIDVLDTFYEGKHTVKDMIDEINKLNAEGDKFVGKFASGMDETSKRVRKSFEDIKAISTDFAKNRSDYELRVKVSGIDDVQVLDDAGKAAIDRLDIMSKRVPKDFEERERFQKELEEETEKVRREANIYEARRQQILDEQRAAAIRAADEKKKADADEDKRAKDEHNKRMKEIEDEKNAKIKADDEAAKKKKADLEAEIKAKQQAAKDWLEQRRQQMQGNQQASQSPTMPSTPSTDSAPNKYGEGEAPTAAADAANNAFAGAANMDFGIQTDFMGGQNSFDASAPAGSDPFQAMVDSIDKKLNEANIVRTAKENAMEKLRDENNEKRMQTLLEKFGTTDKRYVQGDDTKKEFAQVDSALRKAYRSDERDAAKEFDKTGPSQAERKDAIDEITSKATEIHERQNKITESDQEFKKTATDNIAVMAAKMVGYDNYIKSQTDRMKLIGQQLRNTGRGNTPSNATSQARANP